jgi:hypothetical protein
MRADLLACVSFQLPLSPLVRDDQGCALGKKRLHSASYSCSCPCSAGRFRRMPHRRPQDSPASSVIRGTVVNKVTHEPVSRALVSSSDGSLAAMTDGEGLSCRRNEARPESSHPLESRIFGGIIKLVGIAGAGLYSSAPARPHSFLFASIFCLNRRKPALRTVCATSLLSDRFRRSAVRRFFTRPRETSIGVRGLNTRLRTTT